MPTADEIKRDNGFEIGEMQVKLTEKIEELYLHVISLEEKNDALAKQNEQFRQELMELKAKH